MPFYDHTSSPYDYERTTRGLAEKLQAYMDLAGDQEDETVAEGIRGTAMQIYDRWRHFAIENNKLKAEDDSKCRKILNLS